ncbi:helicase-related protein [Actinotignum timonense]|uniref:helicase-related protein n=1 Tax=Actinotignum timonense TaxID=1870995 RepID=UPI0013566A30|nr:SNF2-related protein [Actinotignum timonense]
MGEPDNALRDRGVLVDPPHLRTRPQDTITGVRARVSANIRALELAEQGGLTERDLEQVALFSGWGGLGEVFDETKTQWSAARARLHDLLGQEGYKAARRSVVNAHYTHIEYVTAIWDALKGAGVESGAGLEPGCGIGHFIAHAPNNLTMTGIELDSTAARLAQLLAPSDTIRPEGFETTTLPPVFDVAVGNVPFADVALFDPAHNPGRHSMHNHFIIKSLDLLKPGGYAALITSTYTLDAKNPAARRDLYERADLVAAIRLPNGAHSEAAGTSVASDLLIFRKRTPGDTPQEFTWEHTHPVRLPRKDGSTATFALNNYFLDHPANLLGELEAGSGMGGRDVLTVQQGKKTPADVASDLSAALTRVFTDLPERLAYSPQVIEIDAETLSAPLEEGMVAGSLRPTPQGMERLAASGEWESVRLAKKYVTETHRLYELFTLVSRLVSAEETAPAADVGLEVLRTQTRTAYETYVAEYGALNRNTKSIRIDKNGEEVLRVTYPQAVRVLKKDPRHALLFALEKWDDETERATPADILSSRQLYAPYTPKGAQTTREALAMSLEQTGGIDLPYMHYLLGFREEVIGGQLIEEGLAFLDPETGALTRAPEYLSGNVREKLAAARSATQTDPQYAPNVEALEKVMPEPIDFTDITPSIGASWIPIRDYQQFLRELLDDGRPSLTLTKDGAYSVNLSGAQSRSYEQETRWGTTSMRASDIFTKLLNANTIEVTYTDPDNKNRKLVDMAATAAAVAKGKEIEDHFKEWVFADATRTERLVQIYNERFNSLVGRDYTDIGSGLTLPGLSSSIQLYDHQKTAIARMLYEPTCGLFHEVGAGKTLAMVCAVMEQHRLGLVTKPLVVVPNHLVGQFRSEWLAAYPAARLLTLESEDISKANKAEFFARARMGNWDAIICSHYAFGQLPLGKETIKVYEQTKLDETRARIAFEAAQSGDVSISKLESKMLESEASIKREINDAASQHDDSLLSFESLGVDYLVVDEAHAYKNLPVKGAEKFAGLLGGTSSRALDLDMIISYLRSQGRERICTLATATPVANSMGEMWVMMHYLRPDILAGAGVGDFTAWARQFASASTAVEMNAGGGYVVKQRFTTFSNLPELLSMWQTFADVKLTSELGLNLPEIKTRSDGERRAETLEIDLGGPMEEFRERLEERETAIKAGMVSPTEDNYLCLTNDGITFATDYRLFTDKNISALNGVDTETITHQKVDVVADNVCRVWNENKDNEYLDETGEVSPTRGALQIVFCDKGTPKTDGSFDMYHELKRLLVEKGVPESAVAFVHEAKNTLERDALYKRARSGSIQILIGSTEKLGTGANIQTRAVAIHHVDVPWRPADHIQRNGRVFRQKNQNSEVAEYRYCTLKSLDTMKWQTLERKAAFIGQVMTGKYTGRTIEDLAERQMSYAETKAIASGDQMLMRSVDLKNQIQGLKNERAAWRTKNANISSNLRLLGTTGMFLDRYGEALTRIQETLANPATPVIKFDEQIVTERKAAAARLNDALSALPSYIFRTASSRGGGAISWNPVYSLPKIEINGVKIAFGITTSYLGNGHGLVAVPAAFAQQLEYYRRYFPDKSGLDISVEVQFKGTTIPRLDYHYFVRLENMIGKLDGLPEKMKEYQANIEHEKMRYGSETEERWSGESKLATLEAELKEITASLRDGKRSQQQTINL